MRYGGEVRFRFIGARAEAAKYTARGRLVLGELWNRDRDLGGNTLAHRRVILSNGVTIAVWINDFMPIIEIDARGGVVPEPPSEQGELRGIISTFDLVELLEQQP